jgi:hypothetical protein
MSNNADYDFEEDVEYIIASLIKLNINTKIIEKIEDALTQKNRHKALLKIIPTYDDYTGSTYQKLYKIFNEKTKAIQINI